MCDARGIGNEPFIVTMTTLSSTEKIWREKGIEGILIKFSSKFDIEDKILTFYDVKLMTLPQYCQVIASKAQKNNEPLLSQAIWRDTILKHFACTRNVYVR